MESDEEEVEDLCAMEQIEEILRATYDRKTKGHGFDAEEGTPFQIRISVEPTTPCVTKTSERKEYFRQPTITGRRSKIGQGTNGNLSVSMSSCSSSQLYTPHGGSTTNFTMVGAYPTI